MVSTYFIYHFILIFTTLSAYLYERSEDRNKQMVFLFFSFFIPFIFLVLRYDVGQDYHNYVEYFHKISSGMQVSKEPAYIWLNQFLAEYNLDVQWMFVFFGFFTLLFFYIAVPRDGFALSIFLYLLIFYFFWVFTSLRETLAISIMFYASKYIYQKKFWKYFLWFLVASMFHVAMAFLLLLVYPFANKKINKFFLIGILLLTLAVVVSTDLAHKIVEIVVSFFPKYTWYLDSKYMQPAKSSTGYLGPMIKIAIGILVIYFKDKIIERYPQANVAINLYVLSLIGSLLRLDISIFSRMEAAYMLYFILSIVYFVKTFNRQGRLLVIFIVSLFYYATFIHYLNMATKDQETGLYLIPYRTILNKHTGDTNVFMP